MSIDLLRKLVDLFQTRRQEGHTKLGIRIAKAWDAIYLVADVAEMDRLRGEDSGFRVHVLRDYLENGMHGEHGPIYIDHYALCTLIMGVVSEIEQLKSENETYRRRWEKLHDANDANDDYEFYRKGTKDLEEFLKWKREMEERQKSQPPIIFKNPLTPEDFKKLVQTPWIGKDDDFGIKKSGN